MHTPKSPPPVVWITGLPGSGKSTYADALKDALPAFAVLRMDELRKIATPSPAYSESERDILYRSLVFAAKALAEAGRPVIIDATGHLRLWRELARGLVPGFKEVYLKCPLDICMEREKKRAERHEAPAGIYEKAAKGWPVPGLNVPYEEPLAPELTIDSAATTVKEGVALIRKTFGI